MGRTKKIVGDPNLILSETGVEVRQFSDDRGTEELQLHGEVFATTTNEGRETRRVYKTSGLLRRLLNSEAIREPAFNAGQMFEERFTDAHLDSLALSRLERVGHSEMYLSDKIVSARRRIYQVMTAFGGSTRPKASALWHCVGVGMSLKDWASQRSNFGAYMHEKEARGILCTALTDLGDLWHVGGVDPDDHPS